MQISVAYPGARCRCCIQPPSVPSVLAVWPSGRIAHGQPDEPV